MTICRSLFTFSCFFFFNDPATTEFYTLSLHDALPISVDPGRIADSDQACGSAVDRDQDDGLAFSSHLIALCRETIEPHRLPLHQSQVPDRYKVPFDGSDRPVSWEVLKALGLSTRRARATGAIDDRPGQRMFRVLFDCRRESEQFAFLPSVRVDIGDFRCPLGQGAGLIHHHDVEASRSFDRSCVLEQDSPFGA